MENRNSKISYTKENCLSPLKFPSEFNAKPNTVYNERAITQPRFDLTISQFPLGGRGGRAVGSTRVPRTRKRKRRRKRRRV